MAGYRYRGNKPITKPLYQQHGNSQSYNRGCRCEECQSFNTLRTMAQRIGRKPLPPGDPRHGTYGGYTNWDCRCAKCSAVGRAMNLSYYYRTYVPADKRGAKA